MMIIYEGGQCNTVFISASNAEVVKRIAVMTDTIMILQLFFNIWLRSTTTLLQTLL